MLKLRHWYDTDFYDVPITLALGSFDSIHYGHQELLKQKFDNLENWVLYFEQDPQARYHNGFKGMVRSRQQRLEIFENLELSGAFGLDFSTEISTMDGIKFIEALCRRLSIFKLIVGEDFRFGTAARTTNKELVLWGKKNGVEIIIVPLLRNLSGLVKYSSSELRRAVIYGNFDLIARSSGYRYSIDLRSLPCYEEHHQWYYDANTSQQVLPRDGTYETIHGELIHIKNKTIISNVFLEQVLL